MVIWLEGSVLRDSVGVLAVYLLFNRLCVKQITVMLICKLSDTLKLIIFLLIETNSFNRVMKLVEANACRETVYPS